jgi:Type ISP C-terminal specificity domain
VAKRQELEASADAKPATIYASITPSLDLGLPFVNAIASSSYFSWPKLTDLLPVSFPGVKTSRDEFLVGIDREPLELRIASYFDTKVANDELRARFGSILKESGRYDPIATRSTLLARGMLRSNIVRYTYRPFDVRWLYWEPETKLLDEKRTEYWDGRIAGQPELIIPRAQRKEWSPPLVTRVPMDLNAMDGGASAILLKVRPGSNHEPAFNIPASLNSINGADGESVFFHCLAILHSPAYFSENSGAMRQEQPRLPFPRGGVQLRASAGLGATISQLLDPEVPVLGVSSGALRTGLATLGLPTRRDAKSLELEDLVLTVGWGSTQQSSTGGTIVMPGKGLAKLRDYTTSEHEALIREGSALGLTRDQTLSLIGDRTLDVHLTANAWWSNVPSRVWDYSLGGYQVIKKWLSYREQSVLGRSLKPDEVAYVSEMIRRIAAILLLGPTLDANYITAKVDAAEWQDGRLVI